MNSMNEKSRMDQLQKKMRDAHTARERKRLRDLYGEKFVEKINYAIGKSLSVSDFDSNAVEPMRLNWAKNLADSEGLVAGYISRAHAGQILNCIRDKLGEINGLIGFHEKYFIGLANVDQVDVSRLLVAAESAEDSIVLYSNLPFGVIMVDCYMSQPGEPFSIIVQGDGLVSELRGCFLMKPKL